MPNAGVKLERLDYRTTKWDRAMLAMLQELEKTKPVVWCGDLNVAHEEIDIHNPKTNVRGDGFPVSVVGVCVPCLHGSDAHVVCRLSLAQQESGLHGRRAREL